MTTHLVIPDTQCKPGVPQDHLRWAGRYILERKPSSVIHLGDHWDMESLSSWDKGTFSFEGRRVKADIQAGNTGLRLIDEPVRDANRKRKEQYNPDWYLLGGNHEDRIRRFLEAHPEFIGVIGDEADAPYRLDTRDWTVVPFLTPLDIDGVSYCLTPDHQVLMADLTYKALADVSPGDKIVAFDEHSLDKSYRKYRTGTVLAADPTVADVCLVTLASGKTFQATPDHRWLARSYSTTEWKWVHTNELTSKHEVCKVAEVWDTEDSYDCGYIGGILDGEGWICKPNTKQGGIQVGFAQNRGYVLDKCLTILEKMGVQFRTHSRVGDECQSVRILGPSWDKLRLLGSTHAVRLIEKFQPEMLGRVQTTGPDRVVSVEPHGRTTVIQLRTDTETFIADGYAHHNCHYWPNPMTGKPYGGQALTRLKTLGHTYVQGHQQTYESCIRFVRGRAQRGVIAGAYYLHDEDYKGVQGNAHWRGLLVFHEVNDGAFDIMEVSIHYLCQRYEGMPLNEFLRSKYPDQDGTLWR